MLYVLRLIGAAAAAVAAGQALFGSGVWSAAAVAFVGPRDGAHAGGSLHAAYLRAVGTIAGSVAGLAVVALVAAIGVAGSAESAGLGAPAPLAFLALYVFLAGLARGSSRHAYGVAVAQLTPYVLLDAGADGGAGSAATRRVFATLLGVAAFAAVELFVAPSTIGSSLRRAVGDGLGAAASAVEGVWVAQLGGRPPDAAELAATAAHVATLRAALAAQRLALVDAEDERDWASLAGGGEAPTALRAAAAAIEAGERLGALIAVMQAVLGRGGETAGAPVTALCATELREMLGSLRARYASLRTRVNRGSSGSAGWRWPSMNLRRRSIADGAAGGGASGEAGGGTHADDDDGTAAALANAGAALDAAAGRAYITLVRGARRQVGVPSSQDLLAFATLAWCTHELVGDAVPLGSAVRALAVRRGR